MCVHFAPSVSPRQPITSLITLQVITREITEDEYNRLWATNVAGTFNFSKRLAPLINEGEQRCRHLLPGTLRAGHGHCMLVPAAF